MRIAVTGSAGFIGSAVVERLRLEGHEVTALTRRHWDIAARTINERADAVVHCAALADDWALPEHAMRANLGGTANVIASFPGARFVHLSTSSVYDAWLPTVHVAEDEPLPTRWLSAYSESKAAAERLLDGLDAVVLRPHAVYGPGDRTLLPRILGAIRGRRLVLPESANVLHTLTHIDNLVHAVSLAVRPESRAGVFNIGDADDTVLREVLLELLARKGRPDVAIHGIPYRAAFSAAAALERLHRVTGGRPRLTRYAVSQLGLERTLDIAKARRELGYAPSETTLQGAESW